MAQVVDQLSGLTRARVQMSAQLTFSPGRPGPVSLVPRARSALPGDSRSSVRARGVEQHSWVIRLTQDLFRVPAESTHCPGNSGMDLRPGVFDPLSRATRPWVRWPPRSTTFPDDSRPALRARGVDQLSRTTWASVQGLAGWTICPGGLGPKSEVPWGRPALPGALIQGPVGLTRSPGGLAHLSDDPRGPPAVPDNSRLSPIALGDDQQSWATRGPFRTPAESTSTPE